jgi:hypothetical protein
MSFNHRSHEIRSNYSIGSYTGLTSSTSVGKEEAVQTQQWELGRAPENLQRLSGSYRFREDWNNVPFEQKAIVYYTNGFRRDKLTGIGIYGPSVRHLP